MESRQIAVHLRRASIAAAVSGLLTLIMSITAGLGALRVSSFGLLTLIDAAILFAFAWGFRRASRLAAVLCLMYWLVDRAITFLERGGMERLPLIPPLILFGYFFVQGTRAAFAAHRAPSGGKPSPPAV